LMFGKTRTGDITTDIEHMYPHDIIELFNEFSEEWKEVQEQEILVVPIMNNTNFIDLMNRLSNKTNKATRKRPRQE